MFTKTAKFMSSPRVWLSDDLLRKLAANTSALFSGNIIAALLGLVSLSLTARSLGPSQFGILVMITTYVAVIDKLVNFQSWQAIIKYGAPALANRDTDKLKSLIKFGFVFDGIAALTGAAVAAAAAWTLGSWQGLGGEFSVLAALYGLTLLSNVNGTPTGVLRLYDRFRILSLLPVITAAVKLIGIGLAYYFGSDLKGFLLVWAVATIVGNALLITASLIETRRHGIFGVRNAEIGGIGSRFPGIWGLFITVNLSDTIRMATREVDVLLVGGILGPAAAGIYRIAKQIADVPMMLASPFQQVLYPYLATAASKDGAGVLRRYGRIVSISFGTLGLIMVAAALLLAEPLISILFGLDFSASAPIAIIFIFSNMIFYFGIHLRPLAIVLNKHRNILIIYIVGTIVFYAAYFPLIFKIGLFGAALCHVLFYLTWFALMSVTVQRGLALMQAEGRR